MFWVAGMILKVRKVESEWGAHSFAIYMSEITLWKRTRVSSEVLCNNVKAEARGGPHLSYDANNTDYYKFSSIIYIQV